MAARNPDVWMWSEACDLIARAERLQRQFFQLRSSVRHLPVWEPPADVIETEREVIVLLALPGVDPERVQAAIEDGKLVVTGDRVLPPELRTAIIHRLELPQGRFERRLALPPGRYSDVRRLSANGCLVVSLLKA
ncbi:Hsp20/alpha crystallin family protein [Propylenella binzhouense]|uniref:Hsp20/alpha crystallin family protein n=1 Tax=Propylenella binzhouense TaxID=2555902 RepID=A0A964T8B8_9HYPH|nr:Hsp20/alpha crystallin family protein [Propylenella binzhouense]MYZ49712.1 Hsp20/alpha crystallin family protein [Propylenella binzhouense]